MKNIWKIFQRDVMHIHKNVIALVVIMGITVVPCLYAWFNIAASWDPYGSTGNLKVAVASTDEGYEGNLIPISLNIGDQVLSALRENTQLDWVFTTEETALNGVESGDYYAAVIIPEDFSRNLMSIFSSDITRPSITYYSNAKENAIAPKVTDKGATAIQTQINEVFIETISDTVLTALQAVSDTADSSDAETVLTNLLTNLEQISSDLTASADTLRSFSVMTESAQQLLDTSATFLDDTRERSSADLESLSETQTSFSGIQETMDGAADGVNEALTASADFYDQISDTIDAALESQSDDSDTAADTLEYLAGRIDEIISSYESLRDACVSLGEEHPEFSAVTGSIIGKTEESITRQTEIRDRLLSAAESLRNNSADAAEVKTELDTLIAENAQSISEIRSDYETNVKETLQELSASLKNTSSDITGLLTQLDESASGIYTLTRDASSDLSQIQEALDDSVTLLTTAADKLDSATSELTRISESEDYSQLKNLLGGNEDSIVSFLSSPVSLHTVELYEVENYGSSMAPFYSTLSIWVGGIVLVAMLKVTVSPAVTAGLYRVKPYQTYLGRYIVFLILGLFQSSLICLGDLYYLGIQCRHPFLFLLAGWFTSIVYVNIIYTLTVSFGDVGKAVCVVLLVIQVAGSGGTFPIEVAPKFFRIVYPLLPFTHSMTAMRETIGGMYGSTYWIELGCLCIFLAASLVLGLVLRKPIIHLNEAFNEKLESTHLI